MIQLRDGWVIDSDGLQYTLCKPVTRVRKRGNGTEEEETRQGSATYHRSLQSALSTYIRKRHLAYIYDNDVTLTEAVNELRRIEEDVGTLVPEALMPITGP